MDKIWGSPFGKKTRKLTNIFVTVADRAKHNWFLHHLPIYTGYIGSGRLSEKSQIEQIRQNCWITCQNLIRVYGEKSVSKSAVGL